MKPLFSKQTPQTSVRRFNVIALILSVLLACGLWLYVVSTESPTSQRVFTSVPVKFTGMDTLSGTYGFSLLSGYDTTVDVTLRGKLSTLNALDEEDISAKVDLTDITSAGSYTKKIQVSPPAGTEVVAVSPTDLGVDVDVEKTVTVPVLTPEETFTVAENVQLKRTYSVQSISVKGPQAVVDRLHGVKCLVDLGEVKENIVKTVPLRFVDKDGNEVTDRYLVPSQNTITISYTLYKEKTVPLVLDVSTLLEAERVTQTVTPSHVTVQGPPEQIEALTEVVAKSLTTAEMKSEYSTFSGTVPVPDGLTFPEGTIQYTANAVLSGITTTRVSLDLSGDNVIVTAPEELQYRFASDSIDVNVRTQYNYLPQVGADSLVASINLSGHKLEGTFPVEVTLSVAEEDRSYCYVIDTVTVDVTFYK